MKALYITFLATIFTVFSFQNGYSQSCDFTIPDSPICKNAQTTFTMSTCYDLNYQITWFVNGLPIQTGTGRSFQTSFEGTGNYEIKMDYDDGTEVFKPGVTPSDTHVGSIKKTVTVLPLPQAPQIHGAASFCDSGNVALTATNIENGTYQWSSIPAGFSATGSAANYNGITESTTFKVTFTDPFGCTASAQTDIRVSKTNIAPSLDPGVYYHKRILIAPSYSWGYYWETTAGGTGTDLSNPVNGNFAATQDGAYYVRFYNAESSCWTSPSNLLQVSLSFEPPLAVVTQVQRLGYNDVLFVDSDKDHILSFANYFWVSDDGSNPTILSQYNNGATISGGKIFEDGTHYLRGQDVGTGTWGPTLTVDVSLRSDDELNWVSTKTFDGTILNGNENIASSSKSYFDNTGKALQGQSMNMTRGQVLASDASIKDMYGRDAVGTLPAPTNRNYFRYRSWFVTDSYNDIFDHHDFEELQNYKLGSTTPGTVGWYYSANNTLESNVAHSEYPYGRTQYYPDGISGAMSSVGLGGILKKDEHKTLTGTFPVSNELNYYLTLRALEFPTSPTTLAGSAVQTVVKDENGRYAVSIADKSGKTVMTARNGDFSSGNYILQVSNLVNASSTSTSMNYKEQYDFYVLNAQHVSIAAANSTSPVYVVTNMVTDQPISFDIAGSWPVGFYRLKLTSGDVTISYSNYFQDVACQFYNDAGRLVSSLSPNGFQKIKTGTNLTTDYAAADKTTYKYNHRGWLLSMTEPDAGTTQYMYRKDGSIRYSQNAKQATLNTFSYTRYDQFNRPVESGEYKGANFTYGSAALKATLEYDPQSAFSPNVSSEVNDWVKTHYDIDDSNFTSITGLSTTSFPQNYVRNAVSWTENANNRTWYGYDELGRVVWMAQKPKAANFPFTFVVLYTYDFLGNVTQVKQSSYSGGNEINPFYHHYEYDADKRLSKAYTSTDGSNKTLHAKYIYYLHGPLKRIELAGNLQGIDFIYNIHGWLESINHPNQNEDPGQDGVAGSPHQNFRKDVFGLLLDYYDSEFTNLFPVSSLDKSKDLKRWHHLPVDETLIASNVNPGTSDFFSSDPSQLDYFKKYSAQNSIYKELVKQLSQSTTTAK